jgi:hypothetical protein
MPKSETQDATAKLAHQRPIRLYAEDDARIRKLHERIKGDYDTDIAQLIRYCIRAGLPFIEEQFRR